MKKSVNNRKVSILDNKLTIKVDGPDFPVEDFIKILKDFLSILQDIDRETSDTGEPTLYWSIQDIKPNCISTTIESRPKSNEISIERSYDVNSIFASGFESFRLSSEIPYGFTPKIVQKTRELVELINPDTFAQISFVANGWGSFDISKISNNLIKEPQQTYKYHGSVEGKLITLNNEKRARFGLRDRLTSTVIKCFIDESNSILFQKSLQAITQRENVYVYGEIRQDLNGNKKNITAADIKILPSDEESISPLDALEQLARLRQGDNFE